jgi:putative oxidoreductase
MKHFPFLSTNMLLNILRISVALMLTAHGVTRVVVNTVSGFGEFLNAKGFFIGIIIAWSVTIFEIAGGLVLALGYYKKLICAGFILNLVMGIILVHIHNGWFVVGYSSGGAEYSVLLILCLLVIASTTENKA